MTPNNISSNKNKNESDSGEYWGKVMKEIGERSKRIFELQKKIHSGVIFSKERLKELKELESHNEEDFILIKKYEEWKKTTKKVKV